MAPQFPCLLPNTLVHRYSQAGWHSRFCCLEGSDTGEIFRFWSYSDQERNSLLCDCSNNGEDLQRSDQATEEQLHDMHLEVPSVRTE